MTKLCAYLLAAAATLNVGAARSELRFAPEGVYAMFTQSFARCGQMFPELKPKLQLAERVLERYLELDPALRAAKASALLPQAEREVNAELDAMYEKHLQTRKQRKAVCTDVAAGKFGMLNLPEELFEEVKKGVGR